MTGLLLAALALSNAVFTVTWDEANGGLDSLVLNNDSDRMNWIEGTDTWGTLRWLKRDISWKTDPARELWLDTQKFAFAGMRPEGRAVVSTYTIRPTERGERADPFVNDMDVVLYMAMCSGLLGAYGDTTMAEGQRK